MIKLTEVRVNGYRALADFHAELGPLTVIIGPNACGKSTVLDVLAFVSESTESGNVTDPIAGRGGMESILWRGSGRRAFTVALSLCLDHVAPVTYSVDIAAGRGEQPRIVAESLRGAPGTFVDVQRGEAVVLEWDPDADATGRAMDITRHLQPGDLALSAVRDPERLWPQHRARSVLSSFELYLGVDVRPGSPVRRAYKLGSDPTRDEHLAVDGRNLAGMISRLRSTASLADNFADLEEMCRAAFPEDFKSVGTRRSATGAEEIIEWVESDGSVFHAGELSDGILRFLCLAVLCAAPHPPPLVGIDEPEVGLHPGLLPIVADMLKGLAERTQVIVLTHSPQLLNGFELDDIAVMSKDETGAHLHRPADRKQLHYLLGPTVGETIGSLHVSGELEIPPEPAEAAAALEGQHE